MKGKKQDRFNAELLRSYLEAYVPPLGDGETARSTDVQAGMSQRELARLVGVQHGTVQNWLRGGVPGPDNLRKLANVFGCDPQEYLADGYDVGHSYFMGLMYKIFLKERKGDYRVKVSLTGLVRLGKELGIFKEPVESDLDLPESTLQSLLPQLEARAKEDARKQVMALADANFLKNLVNENREKIEELLSDDLT